MPYKIVWTINARDDINHIRDYLLSRTDTETTASELTRIIRAVKRLEHFPESGKPSQIHNVREVIIPSYRLPYRVQGDTVQILNVFHERRNI